MFSAIVSGSSVGKTVAPKNHGIVTYKICQPTVSSSLNQVRQLSSTWHLLRDDATSVAATQQRHKVQSGREAMAEDSWNPRHKFRPLFLS